MFWRLQNGITLRAQEKRHAMVGNMRDFVIQISKLPFFAEKVGYKDNRLAHESTAAQLILLEINGEPCDVRNSNLNNMYKQEKDFDWRVQHERSKEEYIYSFVGYILGSTVDNKLIIKNKDGYKLFNLDTST